MKNIFYIIIMCYTYLVRANAVSNATLQEYCIASGYTLINQCVEVQGGWHECSILYSNYITCIKELNRPLDLMFQHSLDNLSYSEFSPCGYEISHVILNQKCY